VLDSYFNLTNKSVISLTGFNTIFDHLLVAYFLRHPVFCILGRLAKNIFCT